MVGRCGKLKRFVKTARLQTASAPRKNPPCDAVKIKTSCRLQQAKGASKAARARPFAGRRLNGLQDEGDDRVGGALVFDEFTVQPDAHEFCVVLEVENDDGDFAVGVEGGGGDEVVAVGSADDAFGAGTDEAGELAQNVVRGVVGDFAGVGVGVDDGVSVQAGDIAGVTRAVVLVEDQVPDIPALGPVIEVGDDAPGEAQGGEP